MQSVYYRASDGSQPVRTFLLALTSERRKAIHRRVAWLNDLRITDPPLPFPNSSQIEGELRELRCHFGEELYRIFYQRSRNLFVLLHIIHKDSGAIAAADIRIAKNRWEDFLRRMNGVPRRPPRAAGRDAP